MITFKLTLYKQYSVSIVAIYLTSAYVIPHVILGLLNWENPVYISAEVLGIQWLPLALSLSFSGILFYLCKPAVRMYKVRKNRLFTSAKISLVLLAINGFLLYFIAADLAGYRYGSRHISDNSILPIILYICSKIFLNFSVLSYVYLPELFFDGKRKLWPLLLLISALFLSTSGLASILFAVVASAIMMISKYANELIFTNLFIYLKKNLHSITQLKLRKNLIFILTLMPIIFIAIIISWLYGNSVKMGVPVPSVISWSQSRFPSISDAFQYIIFRHSPDYYSLKIALTTHAYQYDFSVINEYFLEPFRTAIFRLDVLLGGLFDISRPEFGSISRINLIKIANYAYRVREGTSPGPIASFLYCFPLPFNFVFLSTYILLLLLFFEKFLNVIGKRINIVGLTFLTYAMREFFMSPLDIFSIFNSTLIYLSGFILIFCLLTQPLRQS